MHGVQPLCASDTTVAMSRFKHVWYDKCRAEQQQATSNMQQQHMHATVHLAPFPTPTQSTQKTTPAFSIARHWVFCDAETAADFKISVKHHRPLTSRLSLKWCPHAQLMVAFGHHKGHEWPSHTQCTAATQMPVLQVRCLQLAATATCNCEGAEQDQ